MRPIHCAHESRSNSLLGRGGKQGDLERLNKNRIDIQAATTHRYTVHDGHTRQAKDLINTHTTCLVWPIRRYEDIGTVV